MSDLDFRETTRQIRARREHLDGAKALSISLEPNGFVTEIASYGRMRAPRADTATLQSTMTLNELVFACIAIKSTAARDPRLTVQVQKTSGGKVVYEEQPGHPFRGLIMRPNDKMTEGDLMRAAIVSWDISNPRRFYCEKEYKNSLLRGLHPLNPSLMRPKYSQSRRELIGYDYSDGVNRREYSLDELLIRSAPAWYDPPPLVAALGATESDTAQTDYVRAFFENGGVPPGLLSYDMPLSQEKRDEIRDKWQSAYSNRAGRQHGIGVMDVHTTYQKTGAQLDELQSQTLRSVAESRICMVFGVPPLIVYAYVGLLRATYSNLGEAWRGFWDATMSPTFKELRDFWTWGLLSEFEELSDIRSEKVKLAYDMSTVAALQEDVDAIQVRARSNFSAGLLTQDEARAAIGMPPMLVAPPKAAPTGDAAPQSAPILGYHIEQGVVSKNEARAQLGLPEKDESQDEKLRGIRSLLTVIQAAVNVGIPLETALEMVGLRVDLPPVDAPAPSKAAKARTRGSVQLTERRIEKAMIRYLSAEYEKAAQAVGT